MYIAFREMVVNARDQTRDLRIGREICLHFHALRLHDLPLTETTRRHRTGYKFIANRTERAVILLRSMCLQTLFS